MSIWAPVERVGSRPTRSWVIDGAVTLAALAVTAPYGFAGRAISPLPVWAATLIIVAMTAPLLLRRIWPVPVFVWILAVGAITGWWAMQIVWSIALVISLYTVAALRPRRDAIVAGLLLAAAAVVAAVHVVHPWYGTAGLLVAIIVATTGLGLYVNTRQALLAELRDRAARLERERDQQHALAAAAERARIAREMHDIVAHHLTVMVTLSDGAATQAHRAPQRAAEAMQNVASTGRAALRDTRRLLGVLRQNVNDVDGVNDAEAEADTEADDVNRSPLPDLDSVGALVERVRAAGLPVRYQTIGARPDLGAAVQLAVFRIVQEALTNTMKHGGPTAAATVRIDYRPDEVRVQVDDDGTGDANAVPGAGRGLAGMRERVATVGGTVASGPRAPHGWTVSVRLDLSQAART